MRAWLGLLLALLLVAVIVAATPSLRGQARLQLDMLPRPARAARDPILDRLAAFGDRALGDARASPDDPDLLLAAALISSDRPAARAVLHDLAASDGRPVVWAAYADSILAATRPYYTEQSAGIDPDNTHALAEFRALIARENLSTSLSQADAEPVLAALHGWQQADPDNALPVALEAWALWGLGRDDEALNRWTAAAELPAFTSYISERVRAVWRLLERMGLPAPEATIGARLAATVTPWGEPVILSALTATYAGRYAATAGNAEAALGRWQSTIDIGSRATETADSVSVFRAGVAVERIGASPFWIWGADAATGLYTGGLHGGRYFHGPHHDLYAARLGSGEDLVLVRQLAAGTARLRMLDNLSRMVDPDDGYSRAADHLLFGLLLALLAGVCVLLTPIAILLSPRRSPDPSPAVWLALALATLLAAASSAGLLVAVAPVFSVTPLYSPTLRQIVVAVAAPLLVPVALSFLVTFCRRNRRGLASWGGVLTPTLLTASALFALFSLLSGVLAAQARADWLRQWRQPQLTELQLVTRAVRFRWHHPPIATVLWEEGPPPMPAPTDGE